MKGLLEFNLPEEDQEFLMASRGSRLHADVMDFDNYLRGRLKYEDSLDDEERRILEQVREELNSRVRYLWEDLYD